MERPGTRAPGIPLVFAAGLVTAALLASCGGSPASPTMRVADAGDQLTSILVDSGISVGADATSPGALPTAWSAFKRFAAIKAASDDLGDDELSDGLLFEVGTYPPSPGEFDGARAKTFQISFVRQFETEDGDLQQVHLVAHFPAADFSGVRAEAVWSFDTRGETVSAKRDSWEATVEQSRAFRRAVARGEQPLGYEVWQESAE